MSGPRLIPIENVGIFFCLGGSYKKQNELQLHVLFVRNRRGLSRTLSLFPLEISGIDHLDHLGGYLIFTATFDWFSPDGTLQDPFDGNPLQRVARIAFVRFQRELNTKKRLKKGWRQVWNTRGLAQDQNIKIIHQQRGYFGGWCFFFFASGPDPWRADIYFSGFVSTGVYGHFEGKRKRYWQKTLTRHMVYERS